MEKLVSENKKKSLESLGRSHDSMSNTYAWHESSFKPAKGIDVLVTDGKGSCSIAYWNKADSWSLQSSQYFEPTHWAAIPTFNKPNSDIDKDREEHQRVVAETEARLKSEREFKRNKS